MKKIKMKILYNCILKAISPNKSLWYRTP